MWFFDNDWTHLSKAEIRGRQVVASVAGLFWFTMLAIGDFIIKIANIDEHVWGFITFVISMILSVTASYQVCLKLWPKLIADAKSNYEKRIENTKNKEKN